MKVKVMCWKVECQEDAGSIPSRKESRVSRGRGFDSQPEGLGVAFFATGPGLGPIMYILSTLDLPTHNLNCLMVG